VIQSLLFDCPSGGCGAKIDPAFLARFLGQLPPQYSDKLLVGYDSSDDAAVWQLSPDLAVISTVDFFPPMVDDGRLFGQIAAANALSDIYAMGGEPILALNLVCFPQKMDPEILGEILAGGAEIVTQAGAFMAGGHSIYDPVPKYGLAVTGLGHPQKIRQNHTVKDGDALILTKPLGVGLIMSAHRVQAAKEDDFKIAVSFMTHLNKQASQAMNNYPVSAATDITGFGLAGHLKEMAGTKHSITVNFDSIPLLPGALDYAREFLFSSLAQRNRNYLADSTELVGLSPSQEEIIFDPQTSGGLAISLPAHLAEPLVKDLQKTEPLAAIIGQVSIRQNDEKSVVVL
jgi:selenide,water dikinase